MIRKIGAPYKIIKILHNGGLDVEKCTCGKKPCTCKNKKSKLLNCDRKKD